MSMKWFVEGAKGVFTVMDVFGLAPPCCLTSVLLGVVIESGVVISLTTL